MTRTVRRWTLVVTLLVSALPVTAGWAGSIFLTGHDPDFHAFVGGNQTGAANINQTAIAFVTDPAFNPFPMTGATKFLFVESKISAPSGHVNGVNGIVASGFVLNTDFEHHDASDLNAELDLLGTKYSAIVVASDFGGVLTQAELDILNARATDIIGFLNAGGGLYALAESNSGAGLTPTGGHFAYLPFVVASAALNQPEQGNTVTAFGTSLGLTNTDINGNASHNVFASAVLGLDIVDTDPSGNILTLAGRGLVPTPTPTATEIEPSPTPTPTLTSTPVASPAPVALPHFQCYEVDRKSFPARALDLADQFGTSRATIGRMQRFCNPADKNGEDGSASAGPDHLAGYKIDDSSPRFAAVGGYVVRDQFGELSLELVKPDLVMVPSAKSLTGPPAPGSFTPTIDHFQCYRVVGGRTSASDVRVVDQFGALTVDVKRPRRVCTPVDKNGGGIVAGTAQLTCYEIRQTTRARFRGKGPLFIDNQFGPDTIAVTRPTELCVPSEIVCRDDAVAAALSAGPPGVSLLDPATLLSAFPIINTGSAAAQLVTITAITLSGATLTVPASLPVHLGTIPASSSVVVNADFSGGPFLPGGSYAVTVQGTFAVAGSGTHCFTLHVDLVVPPAAPGSAPLGTVMIPPNVITGGGFPPQPPDFDEDEVNPPNWTVPTGPFVPGGPPPGSTSVLPVPSGALQTGGPREVGPPAIVFEANDGVGFTGSSTTAEPSGATGGGVVFVTTNWSAAYSTNGGAMFTQLDPTTIFPADAVGFCCDQIVQYIPSIDRFVWLLQGSATGGYRLATASPAQIISSGGKAWTYWNLTPNVFGACTSFDYPDMSTGNNQLYISWDACSGLQVARTSFAGIQAGGTITVEFTDPANAPMAWGGHLMQDTGDEVFWAGHNRNSNMRVFSLQEGSNTYFWRDVAISTWANNTPLTSLTPDNQNWINFLFNPTTQNPGGGFPSNAVLGSTRVGNQLWFGWSAGTDSNFAQPHIEIVTLDRGNNFSKTQQVQIWNPNYAFAYPAFATNVCTGEVGLSFEFGGGGNYENHVVGFWGDFVAYITSASNVGITRFGDYVSIRQQPGTTENPGNLFNAFGYGLDTVPPPGAGTQADVRYVLFGRPASSCTIIK